MDGREAGPEGEEAEGMEAGEGPLRAAGARGRARTRTMGDAKRSTSTVAASPAATEGDGRAKGGTERSPKSQRRSH